MVQKFIDIQTQRPIKGKTIKGWLEPSTMQPGESWPSGGRQALSAKITKGAKPEPEQKVDMTSDRAHDD